MSNSSYQRSFHEIFDGEFHLCLSKFFIRDRKPTNRVCSLSPPKVGTHSAFGERSHTAAHTAKHGTFPPPATARLCASSEIFYSATLLYTYISRFSVNPQHQQKRIIRQSCHHKFYPQPLFNFSYKWPMFAFTGESGYTLGFRRKIAHKAKQVVFWVGGGITTLGGLCVLLKHWTAACQKGSFAVF